MRALIPLAALLLAACADEPTPQEKAASDAAAIAEVEANQDVPPEELHPQPILYPDIEKNDLYGAGCSFVPEGAGLGSLVLAMADMGYMKRNGEIITFAADKGSAQNPLGSWRKYDGKGYSFTLDLADGEGKQVGPEMVDFQATLTVRDGKNRVLYQSAGLSQCGS